MSNSLWPLYENIMHLADISGATQRRILSYAQRHNDQHLLLRIAQHPVSPTRQTRRSGGSTTHASGSHGSETPAAPSPKRPCQIRNVSES